MPRKSCALALVVACAGAQARERGETEARSARDAQHAKRPELREALQLWKETKFEFDEVDRLDPASAGS